MVMNGQIKSQRLFRYFGLLHKPKGNSFCDKFSW